MKNIVQAVAGVLVDQDGRVLIDKRRKDQIYADYWEFPGGKIEQGESPEEAIKREVKEETGVSMGCMAPLSFISEDRDEYHVIVLIYICREWEGIPQGLEGQETKWVRPEQLKDYELLPANVPLIPVIRDMVGIHVNT